MAQKKRRFVPRRKWLYPFGVEREYQRFAKQLTKDLIESVKEELDRFHRLAVNSALRTDGISEDVLAIMQDIKKRFNGKVTAAQIQSELKRIAQQADNFNSQQYRAVMRSALQVDIFQHEPWLNELVDVWTTENARLITTIPEQFYGEIEGVVSRGLMDGTLTDGLGEQIERVYGVSERRAQLIARDQVGKLNGDLTMYRQTTIGIESYVWSTSKDQRVRPDHADREGKEYRWDTPPTGGQAPGKEIYCRCVALPVVDLDKISYVGMPASLNAKPSGGIMKMGAATGALDADSDEGVKHATMYYKSVRRMKTDAINIAKNTGWERETVDKIKDHVFIKKHDLGGPEPERFYPDYEMSQSWQRLIDGRNIKEQDIVLLNHELMELTLMEQGICQKEAHDIAAQHFNYQKLVKKGK